MRIRASARLPLVFYRRPTLEVARDLLGRTLCRRLPSGEVLRGRLVEVEAYDGFEDRASHAHRGRTRRNRWMFERGGRTYVYLIYGMHHCLNLTTGDEGYPAAVLIRGLVTPAREASTAGPGRLTRVYEIDRGDDGLSLAGRSIWAEKGEPVPDGAVERTPRVGVDYAGEWARAAYRFTVR